MLENNTQVSKQIFVDRITTHLNRIYPDECETLSQQILELIERYSFAGIKENASRWDQEDILLITYGDSIIEPNKTPLQTLHYFLQRHLQETFSTVHILPFFPFSSDDGFSVIDFRKVNDKLGDWDDIGKIASTFKLMVDLVINHVSRESLWFYDYVANQEPARDYFIELHPDTDVSMVTRPRNSPLLVPVNTHRGTRYLWATFSEDQIDLNFSNSQVLLQFIDILLHYIENGAQLIRLDAIAFLWKQLDTSCIHLEQTHEVVKLMRDIMDYVLPGSILLTETNVPHQENLSYFGEGDEAHMVYQFSLAPLLLHAMNRGTSRYITQWANALPELDKECTYLNFTASHDGIGLRALEGLLPPHEIENLLECMHRFGGFVSMKANPDGEDSPYEINISLFDAMQGTRRGIDQWQVDRFICSQAIMLALQGIPAVYVHSLLATPNDLHGVELTGRTRSINRKQWQLNELQELLKSHNTPNHEVFNELKRIIAIRKQESCFHPNCPQKIINASTSLFAFMRYDDVSNRQLLALYNITSTPQSIILTENPELSQKLDWFDLLNNTPLDGSIEDLTLSPYQFIWLVSSNDH